MNKRVLVLGTGPAQLDLIRKLNEMNLEVYAVSYTNADNCAEYLTEFADIDITDEEAVKEYAQSKNIDVIYSTGSDVAMPTLCGVSEDLMLPHFISKRTSVTCNNKNLLREELGDDFKYNVPHHRIKEIEDLSAIDAYPVIVKPSDSQGQRGIRTCYKKDELTDAYKNALEYSRNGQVIVEKLIEGSEISVNAYMNKGRIMFFLMSDRISFSEFPGGIIKEHVIPSKYENNQKTKSLVINLVKDTVNRLSILNGPVYFQIMIDRQGNPYLIEVTPRLDGCHMWNAIKHATGYNLLETTVCDLLDVECNLLDEPADSFEISDTTLTFNCLPTSEIFEKGRFNIPNDIKELVWYYKDGETVRKLNGYMEKTGYYIH